MRWIGIIILLLSLVGCTSTRKLTKRFSDKPVGIDAHSFDGSYSNISVDTLQKTSLWRHLATYRPDSSSLPDISRDAIIQLSFVQNRLLKVDAYQNQTLLASFEIPVGKRKKYLILENRNHVIPIPIIYFETKEDKTVLSILQNDRIGISSYSDHTLWILFFGASAGGKSVYEFEKIM